MTDKNIRWTAEIVNGQCPTCEEIMEQHEKLFKKLEQGNTGYSYN